MFDKPWYKNILLTGQPWCGKSTLLNKIIQPIQDKEWILTKQLLDETGQRTGFEIEYSGKCSFPLASRTKVTPHMFANKRYIETAWLRSITDNMKREIGTLLYLDEIAPMQLHLQEFAPFANRMLDSNNPVLGTIKQNDLWFNFIKQVKTRKDCLILTLDDTTRPSIETFLETLKSKITKSQAYIQEPWRFKKVGSNNVVMQSKHDERTLRRDAQQALYCDCDYFAQYHICSHTIALRQIYHTL